jgi:hypothetical protein
MTILPPPQFRDKRRRIGTSLTGELRKNTRFHKRQTFYNVGFVPVFCHMGQNVLITDLMDTIPQLTRHRKPSLNNCQSN